MKIIENDDLIRLALEGKFDVIVHQCNCFHNFGAGFALSLLRIFPEAFEADKKTTKGDREKMGTISYCKTFQGLNIVNGYSQFGCGVDRIRTEYEHVRNVFKKVKELFTGKRIGYPLYGAGLAGGDWNIISQIIDEELKDENHTLVKYKRS